jgi:hypothetical protein
MEKYSCFRLRRVRVLLEITFSDSSEEMSKELGTDASAARLLWEWINAFSLTGCHVPPNVTSTVNSVLGLASAAAVSLG